MPANKYIPTFTDISSWNKKPYSSTGGTRAKSIYVNNDNIEFFFKGSKKISEGDFKYPMEFWSEIASSKIGQWLGFNVLDYNIAYDINNEQQIGCLSKSMVDYNLNIMSEGIDFLVGHDSSYIPEKDEFRYTLKFIKETLAYFKLSKWEDQFIEMIIFDAIIGNSDRHQENWAFIAKYRESIQKMGDELIDKDNFLEKIAVLAKAFVSSITLLNEKANQRKGIKPTSTELKGRSSMVETEFSPIYDSGCCLGRELEDDKINKMLENEQMIASYVNKGKSEIRFNEGKKPSHFKLLEYIVDDYRYVFETVSQRIKKKYDIIELKDIIYNIDSRLPTHLNNHKLTQNRKELMIKLIDLRLQKIIEIIE